MCDRRGEPCSENLYKIPGAKPQQPSSAERDWDADKESEPFPTAGQTEPQKCPYNSKKRCEFHWGLFFSSAHDANPDGSGCKRGEKEGITYLCAEKLTDGIPKT